MDPALIAVLGAIFGGSGLKLVEAWLNRGKTKEDVAKAIRDELREDIQKLEAKQTQLEAEVTIWRDKYYQVLDNFIQVKNQLNLTLQRLNIQIEEGVDQDE